MTEGTPSRERYPLSWPIGWTRTRSFYRKTAAFYGVDTVWGDASPDGRRPSWRKKRALSVGEAIDRLTGELRRLGARQVIISSNLRVRQDGLPYAQQAKHLDDPGVAVYFTLRNAPRVLACDKWRSVADNVAAIAAHIEAIRAVDRYGVGSLEQAFAGYTALPANASPWWTVLEFEERPHSWDQVESRYRLLVGQHHPDKGGRTETMAKINAARDAARLDLCGEPVGA